MIFRIEDLKEKCSTILAAVDSSDVSVITETLELKTVGAFLYMGVTNKEYYAQVKFPIDSNESLKATVNAKLFLKLISQITTDTVEFRVDETSLIIKANGNYKIPLIYDGDELLELPKIELNNVVSSFDIKCDTLLSILNYNSREMNRGVVAKPVHRLYYIDSEGCITYNSCACVNKFELGGNLKILLTPRLVKLFKLFRQPIVHFSLAYDEIMDNFTQTKVLFSTDDITITSILSCDDALINSVPASAIRARAYNVYPYSVTINRVALADAINRILLFSMDKKEPISVGVIEFFKDSLVLYDSAQVNHESILYETDSNVESYKLKVDLLDIKDIIDYCNDTLVKISFGDGEAIVLSRGNITNIVPEIR